MAYAEEQRRLELVTKLVWLALASAKRAAAGDGITQLTKDVDAGPGSGSQPATVVGLQGTPVAATPPSSGQVLEYDGTDWTPTTPAAAGITQLTGDVDAGPGAGSQHATVVALQGTPVDATPPSSGQVLKYDGTDWTPSTPPITGIVQLTGDVDAGPGIGSQSATVVGLQGTPIAATPPTSGQVLEYDGSDWTPTTPAAAGITQLTGDVHAGPGSGSQAATVVALQGTPVAAAAPTTGQILQYNGADWTPVTLQTITSFTAGGNFVATSTSARFVAAGGAGGGGGVTSGANSVGSAGGGGGAVEQIMTRNDLVIGRQYDVVIGSGGAGGASTGANGGVGTDTTVTDHVTSVVIFRAPGASGGQGSATTATRGGGLSITAPGGGGGINLSVTTPIQGSQQGGQSLNAGGDSGRFFGGAVTAAGGGGGAGPRGPGGAGGAGGAAGSAAPVANSAAGGGGAGGNASAANAGGAGAAGYLDVYQPA